MARRGWDGKMSQGTNTAATSASPFLTLADYLGKLFHIVTHILYLYHN